MRGHPSITKVFFFLREREKGTRITSQNHVYAQCAPHASLNKATASGGSPSAPATACIALGPATNDVANARAHEMEIIRVHRRLQARKAGLASAGGSSRAHELATLSTIWIASELRPVQQAPLCPLFRNLWVCEATLPGRDRTPSKPSLRPLCPRPIWLCIFPEEQRRDCGGNVLEEMRDNFSTLVFGTRKPLPDSLRP